MLTNDIFSKDVLCNIITVGLSKSELLMPVWKVSSPGIPYGSDPLSRSPKPAQLSSICKSQDAGNPHRCQHTTPRQNSLNAAQSHDSKTVSGK